jgi:hypothetical protein
MSCQLITAQLRKMTLKYFPGFDPNLLLWAGSQLPDCRCCGSDN